MNNHSTLTPREKHVKVIIALTALAGLVLFVVLAWKTLAGDDTILLADVAVWLATWLLMLLSLYPLNGIRQSVIFLNLIVFPLLTSLLWLLSTNLFSGTFSRNDLSATATAGALFLVFIFSAHHLLTRSLKKYRLGTQAVSSINAAEKRLRVLLTVYFIIFLSLLVFALFTIDHRNMNAIHQASIVAVLTCLSLATVYTVLDIRSNFLISDVVLTSLFWAGLGLAIAGLRASDGAQEIDSMMVPVWLFWATTAVAGVMLAALLWFRISTVRSRYQPAYLLPFQMRAVELFADTIIAGRDEVITPLAISRNIDEHLAGIDSSRKVGVKLILLVMIELLPIVLLLSKYIFRPQVGGLPFSRMGELERRLYLEHRFRRTRKRLLRDVAKTKQLFYIGYYGDEKVQRSTGFVPVLERPQFVSDPPINRDLSDLPILVPTQETVECEICVIGSGAGGAVAAGRLAEMGHDVVMLEAGPYFRTKEISHDQRDMMRKLWKDGALQSTVDFDMAIFQGSCLGGSTVINNAICFNLLESNPGVLELWRSEYGVEIDRKTLQQSFDRVGQRLKIAPLGEEIAGGNATVLFDGAGAASSNAEPALFLKNYSECHGCGHCNWGCPYDKKLSMLETYIRDGILKQGMRVITECKARKFETGNGGAKTLSCDYHRDRRLSVKAKKYVIACGTIASSVLLLESGIKRNVGKRLSFNATTPMIGLFDHDINAYDGVQMASYLKFDDYIFESWFNPPMSQAAAMPGWFEEHFELMQKYRQLGSIAIALGTDNNAEVVRSTLLRNLIGPVKYEMTSADLAKMRSAMVKLAQVLFEAGAASVYPSTFDAAAISSGVSQSELEKIFEERIQRPDDFFFSSAHPQGGNIMSPSPEAGVIDTNFKTHELDNVYVTDASIFPTTVGVNPQWSIMAFADYAAGAIHAELPDLI